MVQNPYQKNGPEMEKEEGGGEGRPRPLLKKKFSKVQKNPWLGAPHPLPTILGGRIVGGTPPLLLDLLDCFWFHQNPEEQSLLRAQKGGYKEPNRPKATSRG